MIFFDKRAQCQTRLDNAERRKNARSELSGFHRILHDKTALPTNNDSRDAARHVPTTRN